MHIRGALEAFVIIVLVTTLIVTLIPLPIFGKEELLFLKRFQSAYSSRFLDTVALIAYFPMYYLLILTAAIQLFRKDCRLAIVTAAVTSLYVVISYAVIKTTGLIAEVPPRYMGARDLLDIYLPKNLLKLWVGTWGFPSEHLVITAYFTTLLYFRMWYCYVAKMILITVLILIYFSTFYLGDHYPSDLFLNSLVASILFLATTILEAIS